MIVAGAGCGGPGDETTTTTTGSGGSGGSGTGTGTGGSGAGPATAYDPAHVLEVAVTMEAADWEKLRFEANDFGKLVEGDCLSGPLDSIYNYYHAALSVDGHEYPDVAIRKKGFIGSLSVSRPSLKIKLDEFDPEGRFFEADKLTLNNVKQDDSRIRTCLALELFAAAGLPASRCTFAHVTVNGADLGIYANIESVGKSFLEAHFPDGTGNLYEGTMSDFRPDWQDTYEKKTNEGDPDRSDLQALTDALQVPDAELLAAVEPLVDVDAFLTYWATESILGSFDGYTNGQNNHLVYHEPSTGKLHVLPWGPDATFGADDPFAEGVAPQSVAADSALPQRLYGLPEVREQYRSRLLELLDTAFAPAAVLPEIDRMEKLLAPYITDQKDTFAAEVEGVRQFVKDRPGVLQAEVQNGPVDFAFELAPSPCMADVGTVVGSFSTTLGTLSKNNPFGTGDGTVDIDVPGLVGSGQTVGAAAGIGTSTVTLTIVAIMPGGQYSIVVALVDRSVVTKGADLPWDSQQAFGILGSLGDNNDFFARGFLHDGTLHFDEAGVKDGDKLEGTFTASMLGSVP